MMHWSLCICVIPALLCVDASNYWTLEDSDDWKDDFPECGGQEQSPVDLQTVGEHMFVATPEEMEKNKINFKLENYDKLLSGNLTHTGYKLEMVFHLYPEEAPALTVNKGYLSNRYELKLLDLHFKSPHLVDGIRYAMEMHMEHRDELGNIVLVTTLFEKCECASEISNTLLNKIGTLRDVGSYDPILPFPAKLLLPDGTNEEELCDVLTYRGSMVLPPCKEGIFYFVFLNTQCITEEQYAELLTLRDENGNSLEGYRPEQPINNRIINRITCKSP